MIQIRDYQKITSRPALPQQSLLVYSIYWFSFAFGIKPTFLVEKKVLVANTPLVRGSPHFAHLTSPHPHSFFSAGCFNYICLTDDLWFLCMPKAGHQHLEAVLLVSGSNDCGIGNFWDLLESGIWWQGFSRKSHDGWWLCHAEHTFPVCRGSLVCDLMLN